MKDKKLKLLGALCAILLLSGTVLGTMAYFTDVEVVENTFVIGKVAFAESGLDEVKTDVYGIPVESGERTTVGNEYRLLPGQSYTKDPTVHIGAESEDCYVFVKVENDIADIEKTGKTAVAEQMKALGWRKVVAAENLYAYCGVTNGEVNSQPKSVEKATDLKVFDYFVISEDAKVSEYDETALTITAYAIQAEGFAGKSAEEIWEKTGW